MNYSDLTYFEIGSMVMNSLFALIIVVSCVDRTNAMDRRTNLFIRISYILLGTGAASAFMAPFWLKTLPSTTEILLTAALALLIVVERRRKNCPPHYTELRHDDESPTEIGSK
jgi:hypothetical protein